MADESRRVRLRRLVGLAILAATVGGFGLGFGGTLHPDRTVLTWLGYPEYDDVAFLVGMAGLVGMVAYGYLLSRHEDDP